jgi:hypothetical protein
MLADCTNLPPLELIWISGPVRDSFGVVAAGNIMERWVSPPVRRPGSAAARGSGSQKGLRSTAAGSIARLADIPCQRVAR